MDYFYATLWSFFCLLCSFGDIYITCVKCSMNINLNFYIYVLQKDVSQTGLKECKKLCACQDYFYDTFIVFQSFGHPPLSIHGRELSEVCQTAFDMSMWRFFLVYSFSTVILVPSVRFPDLFWTLFCGCFSPLLSPFLYSSSASETQIIPASLPLLYSG